MRLTSEHYRGLVIVLIEVERLYLISPTSPRTQGNRMKDTHLGVYPDTVYINPKLSNKHAEQNYFPCEFWCEFSTKHRGLLLRHFVSSILSHEGLNMSESLGDYQSPAIANTVRLLQKMLITRGCLLIPTRYSRIDPLFWICPAVQPSNSKQLVKHGIE